MFLILVIGIKCVCVEVGRWGGVLFFVVGFSFLGYCVVLGWGYVDEVFGGWGGCGGVGGGWGGLVGGRCLLR